MSLEVIKPGLLTSVQDFGRVGFQKFGVIVSGAMDSFSLRAANLLVGNDEDEAVLEMTIVGPSLYFHSDALIAICGGDLSPTINGHPVPQWQAVFVKKGSTLKFGNAKTECRGYLAVAGGLDIPQVMESRSTYLRAGIGGFQGRALKSGDKINIGKKYAFVPRQLSIYSERIGNDPYLSVTRSVSRHARPTYSQNPVIRVVKGAHYHLFDQESKEKFFVDEFNVQPESDRMGYRLRGATLKLLHPEEMISEAVTFGTVQVPSDGNPIVLMADRQTTGGYPKIAQVISVDLPVMAQLNPGAAIRFQKVTLREAQELYLEREGAIELLKQGIRMHYNM